MAVDTHMVHLPRSTHTLKTQTPRLMQLHVEHAQEAADVIFCYLSLFALKRSVIAYSFSQKSIQ